jgi:HSP20 family protein
MTTELQTRKHPSDPWPDLDQLFDGLRQRFFDPWGAPAWGASLRAFEPTTDSVPFRLARTDVADTGPAYRVTAEIPGIPKESLDIRVRGSSVEIRGETARDSKDAKESKKSDETYVHRERAYAGFYRSLELPEPVVAADAKAKVEDGVLVLELPKVHPTPSDAEVKVPVQ